MKIKETKNKDDLEVNKVTMHCDTPLCDNKGRTPPFPLVCNSGFSYIINGFSGSGKTTLLINLLTKKNRKNKKMSYRGCFDKILFVSPSAHTIGNKDIQDLDNKFENLDHELMEKIEDMTDKNAEEEEPEQILLVLDDVGQYLRADRSLETRIGALVANRRHRHLSIIVISQNLMMIPPVLRKNQNLIITFLPKTKQEKDIIHKEFCDMHINEFNELIHYIFQDKRDFMIIDCSLRNSAKIEFFRNFNKLDFMTKVDEELEKCD